MNKNRVAMCINLTLILLLGSSSINAQQQAEPQASPDQQPVATSNPAPNPAQAVPAADPTNTVVNPAAQPSAAVNPAPITYAPAPAPIPEPQAFVVQNDENGMPIIAPGLVADNILVDKSERSIYLFRRGKVFARYNNIHFGDRPKGHKQFEGDERTPEGTYYIEDRNPVSSYHLSLKISYPNEADRLFAESRGMSPGGQIFIHGQPNGATGEASKKDWTDGCIALSNDEIRQFWTVVPNGAPITIQP
jgi:lipoprotein-anchoring transpeptidase ErfK/SrfK